MNTSFITSFSEQDFKDFLKAAIREVLIEEFKQLQPAPTNAPLGIKEIAALLGQEISTIYEKTSKKLIPHFKKVSYSKEEGVLVDKLEDFLEELIENLEEEDD